MHLLPKRLRDYLRPPNVPSLLALEARLPMVRESSGVRARPGQALDVQFAWGTGPDFEATLATYAYSNWVHTAVSRLATRAAAAQVYVNQRDDPMQSFPDHPLLALAGECGRPNDYQDSFEFWESHYSTLDLAGNCYWFWYTPFAPGEMGFNPPTEIHLLEPSQMTVVPGHSLGVAYYIYRVQGQEFRLMPEQVTHFKRSRPLWMGWQNRYYGISAVEALRVEIHSDRSMAVWNEQFFGEDVAVPAGIMVVPETVSDKELGRIEDELSGKYGERRRTAVVRSPVGGTVYHPAGIAPKDMDFTEGRMLSRKAVYEALELPLGLMSEASTEAHARVAERQLAETIRIRQVRTARKLTSDALAFWPAARLRKVEFEDLSLRSADWDRESKHLGAVRPFMLRNEVRERILHLPKLSKNELEDLDHENGIKSADAGPGGGNPDPVSQPGQVRNVVDGTEQPPSESVP